MTSAEAKKILAELKKANAALLKATDGASSAYISAVSRSQAKLYAQIAELLGNAPDMSSLSAKARLKWYIDNALSNAKVLNATGYSGATDAYMAALKDIAGKAALVGKAITPSFTVVPKEFVRFMQSRSYEHLTFLGEEAITKVDDVLMEMSVGGYTRPAMLAELKGVITGEYAWGDKLGLYEWHAGTYVRTAAQRQAQMFMNYQADKYGLDKYIYTGPLDGETREFCVRLMQGGKFYTKAEIEAMDNGQTGDVFTTCGGFNCRHKWVAVTSEIATAISEAA